MDQNETDEIPDVLDEKKSISKDRYKMVIKKIYTAFIHLRVFDLGSLGPSTVTFIAFDRVAI